MQRSPCVTADDRRVRARADYPDTQRGSESGPAPGRNTRDPAPAGRAYQEDISAIATAERAIQLPPGPPVTHLDHHLAHAATAFYSSPFHDATIVVCDRSGSPELTIWRGDSQGIRQEEFDWSGPGFATIY
jgi:hypothetical protein